MYKKNYVIVEAIQFSGHNLSEVCDFVKIPYFAWGVFLDENDKPLSKDRTSSNLGLLLFILEGKMVIEGTIAVEGDWIIKNEKGEFFRCQPAIFEELYEIVSEKI
jgi:hypothetical protein